MFLMRHSKDIDISTARFANVAFSDGSLLDGFNKRIQKIQPLAAPKDVKRYFLTPQESGELCLLSCIFGENRDIFFPKLNENLHLISFADIAIKYLENLGYEVLLCETEDEARKLVKNVTKRKKWPCLFTNSNTTGEKSFEEFYTTDEKLDMDQFENLGIIKNELNFNKEMIEKFEISINNMLMQKKWTKEKIVDLFFELVPNFEYKKMGKYLDGKM